MSAPPRTLKATTHAFHSDRVIGELRKQASSMLSAIDHANIEIHDAHELEIVMIMIQMRESLHRYVELTREVRRLREMPL